MIVLTSFYMSFDQANNNNLWQKLKQLCVLGKDISESFCHSLQWGNVGLVYLSKPEQVYIVFKPNCNLFSFSVIFSARLNTRSMRGINVLTNLVLLFNVTSGFIVNSTDYTPAGNLTDMKSTLNQSVSPIIPKSRRKRYISQYDMVAILDYHNQVRAIVFPPAANMEYMVRF